MLIAPLLLDLVAIVGGKVHTLVPLAAPLEATILVEGDRIRTVDARVAIPAEARQIDARGLHVIPGLIDGFGYHDPEHDALYVAAGVTTLRDHGNELGRIFGSRDRAERDRVQGPLLSIAGGVLDGKPPSTAAAVVVTSEVEAKEAVHHLWEEKIDFVAVHGGIGESAWRGACAMAAEKGLAVWGPLRPKQALADALSGGQKGFVFLDALLPAGRSWHEVELAELEPGLRALRGGGAALVPALRGYARLVEDEGASASELARLGPQYQTVWLADLEGRRSAWTTELRAAANVAIGKQRSALLLAQRTGVPLVPGSGAPHPWLAPGSGLVRELLEWQAAGIPASACLDAATRGAATTLGLGDRGSIEPGKLADLVLVRGDPSADIGALAQVEAVVLRGTPLTRADLDLRLEALSVANAKRKAEASAPIAVDPPKVPEGELLLTCRYETVAASGRVAAERIAVVRELDGVITLCGRRRILPSGGNTGTEVEARQRLAKGALDSFEIKVRNTGHELVVRAQRVAGQWRVERRLDGAFIDIQNARESIGAIDCDSATTYLAIAATRGAGAFPVVRFDEGLQLEVVRWELALDEDGDHAIKTPTGVKFAGFMEQGAAKAIFEQVGQVQVQTTLLEFDLHGTAGLPLPADKLERMKRAAQTEPKDGKK
ncbi:MAG: amidohydrolase family protein [Planctomycetes bacterium]|nr:amidohydrolase family protein [Planctomycetota bacterium]